MEYHQALDNGLTLVVVPLVQLTAVYIANPRHFGWGEFLVVDMAPVAAYPSSRKPLYQQFVGRAYIEGRAHSFTLLLQGLVQRLSLRRGNHHRFERALVGNGGCKHPSAQFQSFPPVPR